MSESDSQEGNEVSEDCTDHPGSAQAALHNIPVNSDQIIPIIDAENTQVFKDMAEAFSEAERRLKLVEWMDGTDVPSINELRYVSYHMLKASEIQGNTAAQYEELKRAERHCKRASFDALELGIINALENVDAFRNEFHDFPVSDVFSEYLDILHTVESIRSFLANASGGEHRDEYYIDVEQKLTDLTSILTKLNCAREEINKKRAISKRESELAINERARLDREEARLNREEVRSRRGERAVWIGVVVVLLTFLFGGEGILPGEADKVQAQDEAAINQKEQGPKLNVKQPGNEPGTSAQGT